MSMGMTSTIKHHFKQFLLRTWKPWIGDIKTGKKSSPETMAVLSQEARSNAGSPRCSDEPWVFGSAVFYSAMKRRDEKIRVK